MVLDGYENPRDYLNHLLILVFGKEVLKKSSVTGQTSNKFKDKDGKPPLDPVKLQIIYSNSMLNNIISMIVISSCFRIDGCEKW